jgi:hypothetical protein
MVRGTFSIAFTFSSIIGLVKEDIFVLLHSLGKLLPCSSTRPRVVGIWVGLDVGRAPLRNRVRPVFQSSHSSLLTWTTMKRGMIQKGACYYFKEFERS